MLKPLINIIKACVLCFIICVIVAIIFEFVCFPHSSLLQQFSIGAACSFIVVIISTMAQYKMEFKRIISGCISAASNLIFTMALYTNFQKSISDKFTEKAYIELETEFEKFSKAEQEIVCITKKATNKEFKKNNEINELYLKFAKKSIDSHEAAVRAVTDKDSIIRAIDTYLNCWPECYQKEHIAIVKGWLVEESDEEEEGR